MTPRELREALYHLGNQSMTVKELRAILFMVEDQDAKLQRRDKMTPRELREALYHLSNQNMTVKELREMLFVVEDQDAKLELGFGMWAKLEAKHNKNK